MDTTNMAVTASAVATGAAVAVNYENQLAKTNFLLGLIVFLMIFMWCEKKLNHIAKKFQGGA